MFQSLLLAAALTTPAAGIDPPAEKIAPPQGPPPTHVVARLKDGQLQVERTATVISYQEDLRTEERVIDGRRVKVTTKVTIPVATTTNYTIAVTDAKVYGTDGKEIDPKKVNDLLKKDTVVLMSADGKPIDPFYLRTVKEGTLLIVAPMPKVDAPPVPMLVPAPAPPKVEPPPPKPDRKPEPKPDR